MTDLYAEYERAALFFEAGDPIEAARLLVPVVDAEPGNASARLLLARAYFASAQLNRAEEHLRWLVDRDPSDDYAHFVLGRTLQRQGRGDAALTHLRIAVALNARPEYAQALDQAVRPDARSDR